MTLVKLAIVIGHTKKRPGAKAAKPLDMHEYEYNSKVAQVIFRMAKVAGIDAKVFTRDKGGIKGAYEEVNKWVKPDEAGVAIELHFNAYNKKARGTETLFSMDPPSGIDFAREVHQEVVSCFRRRGKDDRGLKRVEYKDRGGMSFKSCEIPLALLEPAFGDNPDDSKLLLDLLFEYSAAIVKGVANYFNLEEYKQGMN